MEQDSADASQHPTDLLIRTLIYTESPASTEQIDAIAARIATAPFDPRERGTPLEIQGLRYFDRPVAARAPSLAVHLYQRIFLDRQWTADTTPQMYLEDFRRTVRDPTARLVVYQRRGGHVAGVLAPTGVPSERRGSDALPWTYVVHSADRGMLVTGYQVRSLQEIRLPERVKWLS